MRIIDIYWNTRRNIVVDENGNALPSASLLPHISYKEKVLVRLRIVDVVAGEVIPVAFPISTVEFSAAIDDDFNQDTALYLKSGNDKINVEGDWYDEEDSDYITAEPLLGHLSIRLDAFNANFIARLGTNGRNQRTLLEVQAIRSDNKLSAVYRIPFVTLNLIDDDEVVPPALDEGYGQKWVEDSDGLKRLAHYFADADAWYYMKPMIVAEQPTYTWILVED